MLKSASILPFLIFLAVAFANCGDDFLDVPENPNTANPPTETTDADAFETLLRTEMEQQNIPAIAALVFNDNSIVYEGYLGKSDVEADTDLADNQLFLLASISKTITATALLQLYDQGLFDLDDPINDYLPFEVNVPNQSTPITFRMLLTHTSGINDGDALDDQYYFEEDSPVTLRYFLENYLTPDGEFYNASQNFHDFEPGTAHEYTNEGSALIGLLVEIIAEQDFSAYCQEHIFEPLNMNNSFWHLSEINQPLVQLYEDNEKVTTYTFTDYPNGGLRSTAQDLYQFNKMLMNGGSLNNAQILKATTVTEMLRPQISDLDNTMGLHFFLMNQQNNLWGHDGGEQGITTIMAFNPETKVGAIILSNISDANLEELLVKGYELGVE